jgi:hypothetical protein
MCCPNAITVSDLLPSNWWEMSGAFSSSTPQGAYTNYGCEDLDGDLELFLGIQELLTGKRES